MLMWKKDSINVSDTYNLYTRQLNSNNNNKRTRIINLTKVATMTSTLFICIYLYNYSVTVTAVCNFFQSRPTSNIAILYLIRTFFLVSTEQPAESDEYCAC